VMTILILKNLILVKTGLTLHDNSGCSTFFDIFPTF
jgi:hypothetical protein